MLGQVWNLKLRLLLLEKIPDLIDCSHQILQGSEYSLGLVSLDPLDCTHLLLKLILVLRGAPSSIHEDHVNELDSSN